MSNKLTTLNISQDFYNYVAKKASAEERSIAQYIRNAVKVYSGYSNATLATKIKTSDDLKLEELDFPDEQ
jgi:hypothetical protein